MKKLFITATLSFIAFLSFSQAKPAPKTDSIVVIYLRLADYRALVTNLQQLGQISDQKADALLEESKSARGQGKALVQSFEFLDRNAKLQVFRDTSSTSGKK